MFRIKILFVFVFTQLVLPEDNIKAAQIIPTAVAESYRDTTGIEKREPKQKKTNSFAIAGLATTSAGLLSIFLSPAFSFALGIAFVLMIGGLVFSNIALRQIKKRNEKGLGMAKAGIIIGGTGILLTILALSFLLTLISGFGWFSWG